MANLLQLGQRSRQVVYQLGRVQVSMQARHERKRHSAALRCCRYHILCRQRAQAPSAPPLRSERRPQVHHALQRCSQSSRRLRGLRSQQAGCPGLCQRRNVRTARLCQVTHALPLGLEQI